MSKLGINSYHYLELYKLRMQLRKSKSPSTLPPLLHQKEKIRKLSSKSVNHITRKAEKSNDIIKIPPGKNGQNQSKTERYLSVAEKTEVLLKRLKALKEKRGLAAREFKDMQLKSQSCTTSKLISLIDDQSCKFSEEICPADQFFEIRSLKRIKDFLWKIIIKKRKSNEDFRLKQAKLKLLSENCPYDNVQIANLKKEMIFILFNEASSFSDFKPLSPYNEDTSDLKSQFLYLDSALQKTPKRPRLCETILEEDSFLFSEQGELEVSLRNSFIKMQRSIEQININPKVKQKIEDTIPSESNEKNSLVINSLRESFDRKSSKVKFPSMISLNEPKKSMLDIIKVFQKKPKMLSQPLSKPKRSLKSLFISLSSGANPIFEFDRTSCYRDYGSIGTHPSFFSTGKTRTPTPNSNERPSATYNQKVFNRNAVFSKPNVSQNLKNGCFSEKFPRSYSFIDNCLGQKKELTYKITSSRKLENFLGFKLNEGRVNKLNTSNRFSCKTTRSSSDFRFQ